MGEVGGGRLGGPLPSGFRGDPSLSLPRCRLVRDFCGPSRGPLHILVAREVGKYWVASPAMPPVTLGGGEGGVTCPRLPPGLWREGVTTLLLHSSLVCAKLPTALKITLRHSEVLIHPPLVNPHACVVESSVYLER